MKRTIPRTCEGCGLNFLTYNYGKNRPVARFCSLRCSSRRKRAPFADRFWSKVNKDGPVHAVLGTPCWLWTGFTQRNGYGRVLGASKRTELAHRASWLLAHGERPGNLCVMHACDNPPCVNPAHLRLGTAADNSADMVTKSRSTVGERNPMAKLTAESVVAIRDALASGQAATSLSARYGVSRGAIRLVKEGVTWKT